MKTGLIWLFVSYMLSQFYRAFMAVMAPALITELGVSAEDLARSNGIWFLAFAAAQIPVGIALDRFGPRRTTAVALGLFGGTGGFLMATAQTAFQIDVAMAFLGLGCAPILMAGYFIFARIYPVARFASMAGAMVGVGGIGNVLSSLPLAWSMETFGWRETLMAISVVTVILAGMIAARLQDPPALATGGPTKGSVLDVLRIRALWPVMLIILVAYAPTAGLRGLWAGPYFSDVHGLDVQAIGIVTLLMSLGIIAGSFGVGPLSKAFGSVKWVAFGTIVIAAALILTLAILPAIHVGVAAGIFALTALFGASYPLLMAHGRSFIPAHLLGRGVTLLNLFSIGGGGIVQFFSGDVFAAALAQTGHASDAYRVLFAVFGGVLALGVIVYATSRAAPDAGTVLPGRNPGPRRQI